MSANVSPSLKLQNDSRVGVMGGGSAGSFFTYFLLEMADRASLKVDVCIYESRDFNVFGPGGCNMCGGILSESLVQELAAEGITLPPNIVQRSIDSYTLHMDVGDVQIKPPLGEKRIAAVHRGAGPRGLAVNKWLGFDGYLQSLVVKRGARVVRERIEAVSIVGGRPQIRTHKGEFQEFDLLAVAVGVNTSSLSLFESIGYSSPQTTKTHIREYYLGEETVNRYIGNSMHIFLLDIPRLKFAAIIPKGEYVTVCMVGHEINAPLIQAFFDSPEVRQCMPRNWRVDQASCYCSPRIAIAGALQPFTDRIVFIGDCGVTRLYKDGIGAAYRAAKAAAITAIFQGVSAENFRRHYLPACRKVRLDNWIGKLIFWISGLQLHQRRDRIGILRMVADEQNNAHLAKRMSTVLWDMFTGSAPYREIFLRTLHPFFIARLLWSVIASNTLRAPRTQGQENHMQRTGSLGKLYNDGEVIVRQGDMGDCMYVIQEGEVEIAQENGGKQIVLAIRGKDEFFGEMAIFEHDVRSATVRARGATRVLTVDKGTFLRRIHEDPSLAYRVVQEMSKRIRELSKELVRAKGQEV